jgi:hypothetical protein
MPTPRNRRERGDTPKPPAYRLFLGRSEISVRGKSGEKLACF